MTQNVKEVLEQEKNINFFIQDVEVTREYHDTYHKLYVRVRDPKQSEIQSEHLIFEGLNIGSILKDIYKLNAIYRRTDNDKLAEGAKEEILKLIALLIWSLERWKNAIHNKRLQSFNAEITSWRGV